MKEELRAELRRREQIAQEARMRWIQLIKGVQPGEPPSAEALELGDRVAAIDAENTAWLRGVVREHGWPGRSMVGDDASHAAWLLVQHADRDPASSVNAWTYSKRPLRLVMGLHSIRRTSPIGCCWLRGRHSDMAPSSGPAPVVTSRVRWRIRTASTSAAPVWVYRRSRSTRACCANTIGHLQPKASLEANGVVCLEL